MTRRTWLSNTRPCASAMPTPLRSARSLLLACREGAFRSGQEGGALLGQPVRGNAEVSGDGIEALSVDEPLDDGRLARCRFSAALARRHVPTGQSGRRGFC